MTLQIVTIYQEILLLQITTLHYVTMVYNRWRKGYRPLPLTALDTLKDKFCEGIRRT